MNWEKIAREMQEINYETEYYVLTLTADDNGQIFRGTQTHWVGFLNNDFTQEIRAPSLVDPERTVDLWNTLSQPYLIINNEEHFTVFCILGGNALIAKNVAEDYASDLLKPTLSARSGRFGFISVKSLTEQKLKHAPTPKHRMRVLKRDEYRCRICGQRPDDDVNIVLHVHIFGPGPEED